MKLPPPPLDDLLELLPRDRMQTGGQLRLALPDTPGVQGLLETGPWEHLPLEYWPWADARGLILFAWAEFLGNAANRRELAEKHQKLAERLAPLVELAQDPDLLNSFGPTLHLHLCKDLAHARRIEAEHRAPGPHLATPEGSPSRIAILIARLWRIFDRFSATPTIGNTSRDVAYTPYEGFLEEFRYLVDPEESTSPSFRLPSVPQLREKLLPQVHAQCLVDRENWMVDVVLALPEERMRETATPLTMEARALKKSHKRVGKK